MRVVGDADPYEGVDSNCAFVGRVAPARRKGDCGLPQRLKALRNDRVI